MAIADEIKIITRGLRVLALEVKPAIAALDEAADKMDALEAENARLREALQQIANGNHAPPGGKRLSDAKMAMIARRALKGKNETINR